MVLVMLFLQVADLSSCRAQDLTALTQRDSRLVDTGLRTFQLAQAMLYVAIQLQ
jgi:hypothetical protein